MKECESRKIKVMNLKSNNQINNNNNDNDLSTDVFPVARNRFKSLFNEFKIVGVHPSAPAINFSEKNIDLPEGCVWLLIIIIVIVICIILIIVFAVIGKTCYFIIPVPCLGIIFFNLKKII